MFSIYINRPSLDQSNSWYMYIREERNTSESKVKKYLEWKGGGAAYSGTCISLSFEFLPRTYCRLDFLKYFSSDFSDSILCCGDHIMVEVINIQTFVCF